MKLAIELAVLTFLFLRSCGEPVAAESASKAGIGIRMTMKEQADAEFRKLILSNDLIDCVYLGVYWAAVEAKEGEFDFSELRRQIGEWSSTGKHVVIQVVLYGQAVDNSITPAWVFQKSDVKTIRFSGGGVAKGREVRVPAVWQGNFAEHYISPLVSALAREFDGDNRIWYVHPGFGHLGHLTAQPSRDGGPAFLAASWTPESWSNYCKKTTELYRKNFKKSALMFSSSPKLITDKKHQGYAKEALQLCTQLAQANDAVLFLGVNADASLMSDLGQAASEFAPLALEKNLRLGMGDDWPLWVPESRRGRGPTYGEDAAFLEKALSNCFEFQNKTIPTTFLYLNPPEALASLESADIKLPQRYSIYSYDEKLHAILKKVRDRLFLNDKGKTIMKKKDKV